MASQIADMVEKVMLVLYGNKDYQTFDDLQKFHYNLKVATSKNVLQTKAPPPTSNAAVQHSYRVNHQVQIWLGNEKDPLEWGWYLKFGQLWPLTMTQPVTPGSLLRCACTTDCTRNSCSSQKYNMVCSEICANCNGTSCNNSTLMEQ